MFICVVFLYVYCFIDAGSLLSSHKLSHKYTKAILLFNIVTVTIIIIIIIIPSPGDSHFRP